MEIADCRAMIVAMVILNSSGNVLYSKRGRIKHPIGGDMGFPLLLQCHIAGQILDLSHGRHWYDT